MVNGGKREGSGRKRGGKNRKTLEKQAIIEAFNQRVFKQVDKLFNAQFGLAVGSVCIFRVDEEETDGKTKRIHTLVTDMAEMKLVLDENEGSSGVVGDNYYLVTAESPDNRAIDSMLNRALGKPKEILEHTARDGKDLFPQKFIVKVVKSDGGDSDTTGNGNQD